MQLLPFNMGVYGELVFIKFYLCAFTYPINLYVKKLVITLIAVLHGDFSWMHRDGRDIDRLHQRTHMSMWCCIENLSISLPSLCIQGKSPCSTALSIIVIIFTDKLLGYVKTHRQNFMKTNSP